MNEEWTFEKRQNSADPERDWDWAILRNDVSVGCLYTEHDADALRAALGSRGVPPTLDRKALLYLAARFADLARGEDEPLPQPDGEHDPETCDICAKIANELTTLIADELKRDGWTCLQCGSRGVPQELVKQIMQLQTYAMNWHGTEFGGLIERDKVLAALRGVGTPQEKEPNVGQGGMRYFRHVDGFSDSTACISVSPSGLVHGLERGGATWLYTSTTPQSCLDKVQRGIWKELTDVEVRELLTGPPHQEEKAPK